MASSIASPIISDVISMRSFCFSNSRMIFDRAGRFICLFMAAMALVAPRMASAMACVDLSVYGADGHTKRVLHQHMARI
jgi:hypothetical protein